MENPGLDIEALKKAMDDEAKRLQRNDGSRNGGQERTEKVLGGMFELSPALASALNIVVNTVQPRVRRFVEEGIRGSATPLLAKTGMQPTTALKTANFLAHGAGWALTFYDEAGGLAGATKRHFKELGELKQRFSKANTTHGGKANALDALKGNELLGVELQRINTHFRTNIISEACGLLASAPQAYIKLLDDKGSNKGGSPTMIPGEKFDDYIERFVGSLDREVQQVDKVEELIHEKLAPIKDKIRARSLKPYEEREAIRNLENQLRARLENTKAPEVDEKTIREMLVPMGAIASVAARDSLLRERGEKEKGLKTTAFDMIEKLTEVVINDKDATSVGGLKFDAYIRKIFDTHQENMGQPKIGKRFDEKLDFACKEIAKSITEGKMHPMALVDLVGGRKIVKDKGKHIATREEVAQAIEAQVKFMPATFAVDAQEYLSESTVTKEDLKHSIDEMQGSDRAFAVSLLPEEVAKEIGITDEEIKSSHETARETMVQNVTKAVLDLAALPDEKLKEAKLSEKQIALIRETAPKAKAGHTEAVLEKMSRKGEFKDALDTTIVDAIGMGLERHPGALFEQAGQTLYAEHEHPGGAYEDADEAQEAGTLEASASSHKHGLNKHHEKKKHALHEEKASQAWDAGEDAQDREPLGASGKKPPHVVHHAQYEGREGLSSERHLGN